MENVKDFEASLMKHLDYGDIDKASLKTISGEIVRLKKNGLGIDQVQRLADGILINGEIDPDFFRKIDNFGYIFKHFEVFPFGIIDPEGLRFKSLISIR